MSNYRVFCFCRDCVYVSKGTFDYECHRYPPKFVDGSIDMFPLVRPTSWCGEFKKKEQEYDGCYTKNDIQA